MYSKCHVSLQILENLEFLNLSHSQYLTETPDFSGIPRLKILILEGCTRLVEVHPSVLVLDKLVLLNFKHCKSLRSLWRSIKLETLGNLILSGCSMLEKFPKVLVTMEHISKVYLDGTGIQELPTSVEQLSGLSVLNLKNCKNLTSLPSSIGKLKFLKLLTLSCCSKLESFPQIMEDMECLSKVYLDGTAIKEVPSSIEHLTGLVLLNLENCKNLTSLPSNIGKLKSLDLLTLSGCSKLEMFPQIMEDMERLSKLYLDGTAIKELPSSIEHLTGLVLLNLENCKNLTSLHSNIGKLKCLELLTLSGCSKLERFPQNLEDMEHLVKLLLDGTAIKELPSSISHLKRLVLLNLENCKNLVSLPSSICELRSLETLTLSSCPKLDKLPENWGSMQNLVDLHLDKTAISQLPSTIVLLKDLQILSLRGCKGSPSNSWKSIFSSWSLPIKIPCSRGLSLPSFSGLCSLKSLDLSDCNLLEGAILSDIASLSSLQDLNLSENNFDSLPASLSRLNCLRTLKLEHCTRLQALPPFSSRIREIDTHGCRSLEKLPYPSSIDSLSHRQFTFTNCEKLVGHQGNIFFQRQCQAISKCDFFDMFLTGSEILKSFNHQSMGSSISFKMPPQNNGKCKGLALCVVFALKDAVNGNFCCACDVSEEMTAVTYLKTSRKRYISSDHAWLRYVPNFNLEGKTSSDGWRFFKASFKIYGPRHQVKKCGVHIFYEQDEPTMMQYKYSQNLGVFHANFDKVFDKVTVEENIKFKRSLDEFYHVEEEHTGSGCPTEYPHPKRLRGHTNTMLKLKGKDSS
ncbi:hypothetical protein L1049_026158 [Liquidambar formosana]|uniref:Uncharacterized protein n=1 Tax=Liquidambar formosana TaxID=63359 RepID=A0AAP0NEA8_LIQFO